MPLPAATPAIDPPAAPIRVAIQQPALPKYRVPVFRELASRPGIDLTLHYGDEPGIPVAEPEGFAAQFSPLKVSRLLGQTVLRHPPQWSLAGSRDADVLIYSWNIRYASLVPSLLRARRRGLPVILWGHGYSKTDTGVRKWLRDGIGGLGDAWLFYDHRTAAAALEGGFPAERVFAAPNALDQSAIQSAREAWLADPARGEAFVRDNDLIGKKLLLYVSRMTPANRLDLLVEALPAILSREPGVVVAFVGKGGTEQQKLTAHAERLGVADRLRFLGPIYEERQLAPWFINARAFVYPANIGLSLLHAFGYGLPVVTSDRAEVQNPEIVALDPGVNGETFRDNDAADLAGKLLRLLGDNAYRDRLGTAAHNTATNEYSLPVMVNGFVKAIEYVYKHRRR